MQKLELTWVGKDEPREQIEPRILIENPKYSYGEIETDVLPNGKEWNGNMLIHGDNLLALKSLEQEYSGCVKCIYIDPPFNTGQAFEYYDDNIEHSKWLNLMFVRLHSLYNLLDNNGLFWIHLDEEEVHYCKVLLDEIFGRKEFVSHITYERSAVAGLGQGGYLVNTTEHILLYKKGLLPNKNNQSNSELELKTMKRYSKYILSYGKKEMVSEFVSKSNGMPVKVYKHSEYEIKSISLKDFVNRKEEIMSTYVQNIKDVFRGNRVQKENVFQNDIIKDMDKNCLYSIEYIPSRGKYENIKTTLYYYNKELLSFLSDTATIDGSKIVKSQKMTTLWTHSEIPKADIAHEGNVYFPRGKKPEQLLKRIIDMSTEHGDIVLDSFLGSGTTSAVAHKMGRKYIGIEMGEQAFTHCYPRLKFVVDGTDNTGISKDVNWHGGGGFKFYELAPSLLEKDKHGQLVINKEYNANMLAAAMAKNEGFNYSPSKDFYWKQGQSSEQDFIYTTTQFLTVEALDRIYEEMAEGESLLICCTAFQKECQSAHSNISIKKIPKMLLAVASSGKTIII
jgi:adenine-specific DNA-methyltransferase